MGSGPTAGIPDTFGLSLFSELKRRNVFRAGIFYAVLAWVILKVADVLFGVTRLPDWSLTLVAIILGLGFVPALIFAWVFELGCAACVNVPEIVDFIEVRTRLSPEDNRCVSNGRLSSVARNGSRQVRSSNAAMLGSPGEIGSPSGCEP